MSEITKVPQQPPATPAETEQAEQTEPPHNPHHPHRHAHVAIHPANTAVSHLDPGVVTFSH